MLRDSADNYINLYEKIPMHILALGKSRSGKTWYCNREIEREINCGKKVMIIDFAGSYTDDELKKNHFLYKDCVRSFDLQDNGFVWPVYVKGKNEYNQMISESIIVTAKIDSYLQKAVLVETVNEFLNKTNIFVFSEYLCYLENMLADSSKENKQNDKISALTKVIVKLNAVKNCKNFRVCKVDENQKIKWKGTIVQLSFLDEEQKIFLTKFMLELIWKSICADRKSFIYDTLVLDEVQHLELKGRAAFSSIMREGGKKRLKGLFATQFIDFEDKQAAETFLQAGQILIFRQSAVGVKFWAEFIDPVKKNTWKKILSNLERGKAVLLGEYHINGKERISTTPIICKVE